MWSVNGLAERVAVSIVVFFGWLIFTLLFLAFFSESYTLFQNLVVVLVVLLIALAILGTMWASWGIKQGMTEITKDD